ncbi:MAG: hypothetical protein IT529_06200 [Burkholderiales bacterium]|nr:hypothetical protein [Burkholderiales bacterium]
MRIIIAALALAALAGCATPDLGSAGAPQRVMAAATLAPVGSFEHRISPTYTGLVMLRLQAARRVEDGRITVETAREILARTDAVREMLDQAVRAEAQGERVRARTLAAEAALHLAAASQLIEGVRP